MVISSRPPLPRKAKFVFISFSIFLLFFFYWERVIVSDRDVSSMLLSIRLSFLEHNGKEKKSKEHWSTWRHIVFVFSHFRPFFAVLTLSPSPSSFPFFYFSSVLLCLTLSYNSINWTRLHYSSIRNWCEVSSHLSSNSQSTLYVSVLSHFFVISLDYSCVVCIIECCPCGRERRGSTPSLN